MTNTTKTLGFIGLGAMGAAMARNVMSVEDKLIIHDQDMNKTVHLEEAGAIGMSSLHGFAECSLVFLSLPDEGPVIETIFSAGGLADVLKPGTLIVDTSTIDHTACLDIAERVKAEGFRFLDAPVSGMESRAIDGTLTIMCGGDVADFERALPYLERMGSKVLHIGGNGAGQLTKLINQLLYNINMAGVAEVIPMAVKLGLDPEQITDVVNSGTGRSHASEQFLPTILKREFGGTYPLEKAYKDMVSAAGISARQAIPLPVLSAANTTYQRALNEGYGAEGKGTMIKVFEKLLNVEVKAKN